MDDTTQAESAGDEPLRLRIAMFVLTCKLISWLDFSIETSAWIIFGIYITIGVVLNILVLRRLIDWHPVNRTLENVVTTKLVNVFFWPISYLFLFFQLAVVKLL